MGNKKETVVLYGLGNAGKSMLPYLRENFDIAFWVDGNQNLWGTLYEGIPIRSPRSVSEHNGRIIVTTTDTYFVEISEFLLRSGFEKDKIFRGQYHVCDQREEIVPYEAVMLEADSVDLKSCDLLGRDEEENIHKVMVFCGFQSSYVNQLVRNCKKRMPDIHFSILSNSEEYLDEMAAYADHIYVYHSYTELYGILNALPRYDVFQMLWIENIWVYFKTVIREKCVRLNLCVGGSDLYRARDAERIYKKSLIDMADTISAETDATILAFVEAYSSAADKIRWVNFGIETLEYLDHDCLVKAQKSRKNMDIPDDNIVIMCGYNAGEAHQHLQMIRALEAMDASLKSKIFLLFPMTYPKGQDSYIESVKEKLNDSGINYRILTDYRNPKAMAELEMTADMLLTVQKTDQLSSTMLEVLYAGRVVIAGSWLPYGNLREKGMIFWSVDEMDNLTETVAEAVENYQAYKEKCSVNKRIVYELSSWNIAVERWNELWSDCGGRNNDGNRTRYI